jgi:YgiT-type zinc finger domain-containing protein
MAAKKTKKTKAVACVQCGTGKLKRGVTTVSLTGGNTTLVVKDVPADICGQCGEPYLDESVAQWIHERADSAAKRGAEVEILRYAA